MTTFDEIDFFTDQSLTADPYPYFEHLRAKCPVTREPHHGVMAVTGYDEAVEVYRDPDTYSSVNSPMGPFPGLMFEPEGDDISAQIEQHRDAFPLSEHMITFDPPRHTAHRHLLKRLLTPKRLKENEEFMWRLADRQLDTFLERGECEFIGAYAQPFALLVIADLLGVPEEDHELFRMLLKTESQVPGSLDKEQAMAVSDPLQFLVEKFTSYVEDRRAGPRDDVLTGMATAPFPDGSIPEVIDVVRVATFLFAAGQETTARLLASSLLILGEDPALQQRLRAERERIPNFVEEVLRYESPVKSDFRLARRSTSLGGVDVPAGTTVMIVPGAVNRDPRRFACPAEFQVDRANVREHIAFGRGVHTCAGAPLARAEARVSLERILDRMSEIGISEKVHGPQGARTYNYEPTFILRGLNELHLEYTPAG
ncbi:cytochrome P450 [Amycolatopsis sp. K13G38]|uniref:Cytochrome P450 n=1 Tax=Amycolatopsis acididurans TaxID=2724524 RepID=A0ABX1IWI0_9PSEU|nr:cytochrome P450 [Amycolatopsis acididurans]NKQ51551.1 cytochrome P450 [Amycolatopsis acididurans]